MCEHQCHIPSFSVPLDSHITGSKHWDLLGASQVLWVSNQCVCSQGTTKSVRHQRCPQQSTPGSEQPFSVLQNVRATEWLRQRWGLPSYKFRRCQMRHSSLPNTEFSLLSAWGKTLVSHPLTIHSLGGMLVPQLWLPQNFLQLPKGI